MRRFFRAHPRRVELARRVCDDAESTRGDQVPELSDCAAVLRFAAAKHAP